MSEWEKVGVVGVDAGMIWIGDPCYILHNEDPEPSIGKNWGEFCENLHLDTQGNAPKQWNYAMGHAGLGVTIPSGLGDGIYDVFVKRRDVEGWGNRITEVKVVFIGDDE